MSAIHHDEIERQLSLNIVHAQALKVGIVKPFGSDAAASSNVILTPNHFLRECLGAFV